ncbi:hypothetical protein E3O62_02470 [Cryobacterium sp. TMT2-15-1]|uniref:hypothetical protein n=1 Tax=Cryobacterium sp. TMT2-15-1 TaxID=1259246 RepID=UPI00106CD31C|nr:hypothetical protein [Cryobacterium sp. TMT2-15-1]TFC63711.1 hypothetical protein E3O62_02470 [Cryobacterium sp. TMT2-15-1]
MNETKESVGLVLDLMKLTFGKDVKTYYNGDPEVIPSFNLPAIIVVQLTDDTKEAQQGEDDVSDQIRIKVLRDKREDYTGDVIDPLDLTEKKIRDLIAGQEFVDGSRRYKAKTVKGALRNALLDGVDAIASNMSLQYGVNPRETLGDAENNAEWTSEGWVTFNIEYSVDTYR